MNYQDEMDRSASFIIGRLESLISLAEKKFTVTGNTMMSRDDIVTILKDIVKRYDAAGGNRE